MRYKKLFLTIGIIATQIQRPEIIEPFRLEVTSGGFQSNLLLKAGSILNSAQVAQGFVWLSLENIQGERCDRTGASSGNLFQY